MPAQLIQRDITIDAPIDVVWRTITEPELMQQWFAETVALDVRPGSAGVLTFDDTKNHQKVDAAIVVDTVTPPTTFSFRWHHPDGGPATPSNSLLVEFTLTEQGDRTHVRVLETGLDNKDWDDDRKSSYADDHNEGWAFHLGELLKLFPSKTGAATR
jgi:uncharacterized protein YndB with AHSA1/START domain